MFSVSLVTADSYQSSPIPDLDPIFSDFRGKEIKHVPVVRIFGSTPTGDKTCLHIHDVFPYMYIPCTVAENSNTFAYKLAASIDSAINVSLGCANSTNQHVYKIHQVSGIPYYGYHENEHLFYKVYFYNPALIKRVADLLQNGAVLSQSFQPFEAHIPFVLQFMIDYNLYGMSYVNLKTVKYRQRSQVLSGVNSESKETSQPFDLQDYLPTTVIRQSMCKLEVDAISLDILNKDAIKELELNPGLAAIWEDEKLRRAQMGLPEVQSQLLYTQSSKRQNLTPTVNDIYQEERLMQRLQIISQTDDSVMSSTTISTYPIEVKGKDDEAEDKDTTQFCVSKLELTASNASKQQKETQETPVEMSNSTLDANDVDLINMLNNLAEENSCPETVDNDSVLGSQGSVFIEQVKDINEEEETEDLNITCFELDTLSSWSSACNSQRSGTEKNDEKLMVQSKVNSLSEPNVCNAEDSKLPQYDGTDDILLNNLRVKKSSSSSVLLTPTGQNCRKNMQHWDKSIDFIKTMDNKNLYHLNLDVYDTDEVLSNSIKDSSYVLKNNINATKSYRNTHKTNFKCRTFKIPSFDGNTVISSSESEPEPEPDITITREEAQVCIYNSCRKKIPQKIVKTTPTKRKRKGEDSDFCTPKKVRSIDSAEKSSYNSPSRRTSIQSPQTSRSYAPLNITISSPRTSKVDPSVEDPASTILPHSCTTPRRKILQLRENLLREGSPKSSPRRTKPRDIWKELETINEFNELQENDPKVILNSEKAPMIIPETHSDTTLALSSTSTGCNKDARKRLSFCSTGAKSNNHSDISGEKRDIEVDLVPSENVANKDEGINSNQVQKVSKLNNALDAKNSVDQVQDDTDDINEILSDEEAACNMTFTQCVDTKMRDNNQSFSLNEIAGHKIAERVVIIKSRFCPPNRNHITQSMEAYDIMKDSREELFGKCKNKVTYKISNCPDVVSFKSSLDNITGLKLWRRMKVNEFHPSGAALKTNGMKQALAGYNLLTIRPLFVPPTPKNVQKWLRAKKYLATMNKRSNSVKDVDLTPKSTHDANVDSPKENENSSETLLGVNTSDAHASHSQSSRNDQTVNSGGSNDTFGKSADSSLQKILTNSSLFKDTQTSKHLGISYGQIECLSKTSRNNLTDENFQNARTLSMYRYLTVFSLEVHVVTRGDLLPDPQQDTIEAIFYAILNDVPPTSEKKQVEHGAIILRSSTESKFDSIHSTNTSCPIIYVQSEKDLLDNLIVLIRKWDPDILVGWELETLSWGYVFQRSSHINVQHFLLQISRIPDTTITHNVREQDVIFLSDVKVPGRIILDVWRIMRHEIALLNYTFENVMYHVMHERHSCPSFKTLTNWWRHSNVVMHYKVIDHYLVRVLGTLRILSQLDIIGRTSEHARLFGIQFYEVFSRGSQFRVESIMLRLAKPLNFIAISPSVQQRARMRAPESLPLIMEPKSMFYTDPLIVLDFQSLYPSIIIAYNYCFSTCLGRIEHIGQNDPFEFGAATLKVTKRRILKLKDKINFAPCGVAYVKREVRQGVLPRMLTEILNTRLMVKESMKIHAGKTKLLQRVLDSQQLGLKLIANVTYGYTAANFSGRMPCIEVGDSVVSKGRETLERAIKIVESTSKWGAQVVYGDTDSIFVLVPGKSRKEAFEIGAEIADVVTAANPAPVKLKFEKVLHPSILQTKKRYCGYMYEDLKQQKPEYLAKGIETVRRDGCPAVAKVLEKSLRILFETGDISLIKKYVTRQFDKMLCKRVSIQDLTFAKEFRGLNGYKSSACVPALELTRRLMKKDPRAIPRTSERVRYVIVAGAPNQPLIQCVRTPSEVIDDTGLTPNALYYITKAIIPPLNRCLNLINVDVNVWYREMSHRLTLDKASTLLLNNQKSTICHFFNSIVCASCGEQSYQEICSNCMKQPYQTIVILNEKLRWLERTYHQINAVCQSCTGDSGTPDCTSLDCPVFYRMATARKELHQVSYLRNIIQNNE